MKKYPAKPLGGLRPSNLFWPNAFARHYMVSILPEAGKEYMVYKLLGLAGRSNLGWENFARDNMERQFDFADIGAFNQAVSDMYGLSIEKFNMWAAEHGSPVLQAISLNSTIARPNLASEQMKLLAGERSFMYYLDLLKSTTESQEFVKAPTTVKFLMLLDALATMFRTYSDLTSEIKSFEGYTDFIVKQCPHCWGLKAKTALCTPIIGMILGAAHWLDPTFTPLIEEIECRAKGDQYCYFRIATASV